MYFRPIIQIIRVACLVYNEKICGAISAHFHALVKEWRVLQTLLRGPLPSHIYIYLRSVLYSAVTHMILRVNYRWHIITSGKCLVFTKVSWSRSCVIRKRLSWITSNSFSCCFNCKYGCISTYRLGCCLYIILLMWYSPCVCWVWLVSTLPVYVYV